MNKTSLIKIIDFLGGQSALAKKLGVKQGHVYGWLNENKEGIPARFVLPACESANWQVTPHQLRPDLYPHPQDGLPEHMREVA